MSQNLSRRDCFAAIGGMALVGAFAGCASRERQSAYGSVGDPLPGEPATTRPLEPTPGREALDHWRESRQQVDTGESGVILRRSWASAGPNPSLADPMGRVTRITVHHDGMNAFTSSSRADAMSRLESIRRAHVGQGWADIGYHYSIDPAGRIYQCRPVTLQGAHVKDNNPGNLGIMLLGNFEEQRPTAESLGALASFLESQMSRFRVPLRSVYTHQELRATVCPGRSLQARMADLRSPRGQLARA
ncbi:MAG: N-acetylmuramoyl-L-alanine amidase [Phycisphaeraceae bacterium]|nr:N-acetylmuramoyl-L-alanine amidase [Phycisphaeraceae bacterium]